MPEENPTTVEGTAMSKLRAVILGYAKEWGLNNMLISVPMEWKCFLDERAEYDDPDLERFSFTNEGKIAVSVFKNGMRFLVTEIDCASLRLDE